jgi:prolipoprotein diacylglyceryltransferase
MFGGLLAFGLIALIVILAVALLFIFWIWMLVDALMKKKFEDKLVWILVIIFLHFIGALLYYFLIYKKTKK